MEKIIEIPEGYEARIEGNKVVIELKESERIRKMLIEVVNITPAAIALEHREEMLAYLEKQKEQKVDIDKLRKDIYQSGYNDGYQHGKEDAQKGQKPAEWSEEDEKMIELLIRHTQEEFDELCNDRYGHQEIISDLKESCRERMNWLKNRLKFLRPQPHWKPSEEQMRLLFEVQKALLGKDCHNRFTNFIYELKELK